MSNAFSAKRLVPFLKIAENLRSFDFATLSLRMTQSLPLEDFARCSEVR
jgi:hypothetical protein